MGTAAHIRSYRVRAGKSRREVAEHLGLNDAWYDELEQRDDELASTLTLFQGLQLAALLGVRLQDLVGASESGAQAVELIDLPAHIERHLSGRGITIEQLEDEIGCEVRGFLESPLTAAAESPIACLRAIANCLGIDWLSLAPDEPGAPSGAG